ncbi:MAG: OmpH family outer membrane protein [Alphaproteobacteria bacterium]|nr:OmpH family outer membrane protein [Alphaproteobacteria bacterium]
MVKTNNPAGETATRKYVKFGVITAIVIAVAVIGLFTIKAFSNKTVSTEAAIEGISSEAVSGGDLRMAVVRMDAIQNEAKALQNLRKQRENYETKLRDELTKEQKALEKEKAEIEKSQDVLSQEALQRRVVEYQGKVTKLQRDLTERAQSVDAAFQKALVEIQEKHLDPIIEAIIAKKNLSLVIDGRFARTGGNIENLDITADVINALDKKVSNVKMDTPKGF